MPVELLLFDVGGVLLTNGWDREARALAVERFGLDPQDFEERHDAVAPALETGRMTLREYVDCVVFTQPRGFTTAEFVDFMKSRSQAYPDSLALLPELTQIEGLRLATLNNESRELNEHRIERFGLREFFTLFLTSSYLGVMKPDERIFRMALDLTQCPAEAALFIDDRPLNVEAAREAGIPSIRFRGADELRAELRARDVLSP